MYVFSLEIFSMHLVLKSPKNHILTSYFSDQNFHNMYTPFFITRFHTKFILCDWFSYMKKESKDNLRER